MGEGASEHVAAGPRHSVGLSFALVLSALGRDSVPGGRGISSRELQDARVGPWWVSAVGLSGILNGN